MTRFDYPQARRSDHADEYHGIRVPDPYRWLEDPSAPEARAWIEAQNELTRSFLDRSPALPRLRERLTELWDYPRASAPWRCGPRYFRYQNTGLQNQNALFAADAPAGPWRELLDPNRLSEDGTVALGAARASRDGRLLAYSLSRSGSDWHEWRLRDVQTGEDLPDLLRWSRFSAASWLPDGSGFYYERYDAPPEAQAYTAEARGRRTVLHRLGTPQEADETVFERPDEPDWLHGSQLSFDGRYLVITVRKGSLPYNLLFVRDLRNGNDLVPLVEDFTASHDLVEAVGPRLLVHTTLDAPNGRIVEVDPARPSSGTWRTVVPEGDDAIVAAAVAGGELLVVTMRHASHRLTRHRLDGARLGAVELPGLGSVVELNARPDDREAFLGFASFLQPTTSYRLDLDAGSVGALETPRVAFDPSAFTTRQTFATSEDGTRVPVFLVHRADLAMDGGNPTILYGYGGFDVSLTPSFSAGRIPWLELGGVLAVANLRGGGEYGEAWHLAGTKLRKQNVFDDLFACAEHLFLERVTSAPRLAIQGGSNGGLLVGAAMTQRPDLFGAALPAVGVLDMLRFHRFTIGWAWVGDYGSSDDPEEFRALLAYSPLHNLRDGVAYPPTLITTSDHDDRVVPAHSFKFAAALQHAQAGDAPVLIRVQTKAGHGAGKPTRVLIDETADALAFLVEVLGIELPPGGAAG